MKQKIIMIRGASGAGKTLAAEYIEEKFNIPMIQSTTDRPKRSEDENGHTFVTKEEFDDLKVEDMIALTKFGDYRYCSLKSDVSDICTYVIDDTGIDFLEQHYSDLYTIIKINIKRPIAERMKFVDKQRLIRDETMYFKNDSDFHFTINNDGEVEHMYKQLDKAIELITQQ